ncbi:MAG: N-acetylglucosaminyltransferase, partial [Oscillospiraceae bacterium]|nr:N-acetylglucosaminyltransferase [Oscillospiraceae bacterium]
MDFVRTLNFIIAAVFFICYSYQFLYIPVALFKKEPPHKLPQKHRFAVLVSARNEEKVVGELIKSINSQTYGRENIR